MRVLVVGDWHSDVHEGPLARAFEALGHEVHQFKWSQYVGVDHHLLRLQSILRRLQNKYVCGPQVSRLNRDFCRLARTLQPDLVFVYRGTHITPTSLRRVRETTGATLIGYNNDDPFSPLQPGHFWRHFLAGVPLYDLVLAYRQANIEDYLRIGARRVMLFRSWFDPARNFPVDPGDSALLPFKSDVLFAGHYEPDGRLAALEKLALTGFSVRVFGPGSGWNKSIGSESPLAKQLPIRPLLGVDYNRAIGASKVSLCFLSKLNRDTYTRRCFEIPAAKGCLVAEYSDDLAGLFKEGEEVFLFRNADELLRIVRNVVRDPELRNRVANAGCIRVHRDGHDVKSRVSRLLSAL